MLLLGIDIGGTKICACLGDAKGKIYAAKRIATQALQGSKKGLPAIASLIHELLQEQKISLDQIQSIGISSPGPISSREGKMLNPPNLPGWENAPLVSFFQENFKKPI